LRQAYETVQPQVVEFISRLSQSKPIYEAFLSLRQGESWGQLDEAQQRIVEAFPCGDALLPLGWD
jgi:oligopeptidase A